jgi:arylsulfatase A-like enzyme
VPLVVRLPGGRRGGTRVSGVAQLVDVPATLLDLAGLDAAGLDGQSLREALQAGRTDGRTAYSETFYPRFHFGWSELVGATDDRFSFVRAPRPELYDLKADPGGFEPAGERQGGGRGMNAWLIRTLGETEPQAPAVPRGP